MAVSLTKPGSSVEGEGDPAGADIFHLGCIRFRPCPEWDLAFRIKWDDREIKLSPVGDNNAAQVEQQRAKIRADKAAGKKLEKATARYESALALEEAIKEDLGISITHLGEQAGVSRNNVTELVKLRGWTRKKGVWVQDKGGIKPHPGAMKSPFSDSAAAGDVPTAEDLEGVF